MAKGRCGAPSALRSAEYAWDMIRARHIVVFCAAAAAPLAALAQDRQCEARVQSEVARLEREYAKQRPDPGDNAAYQRWQRQLQGALQSVAREAESCRNQARSAAEAAKGPVATPTAAQATLIDAPARTPSIPVSTCLDQARVLGDELARRYGGRELSPTEQLRLKSEEEKLATQRHDCMQPP